MSGLLAALLRTQGSPPDSLSWEQVPEAVARWYDSAIGPAKLACQTHPDGWFDLFAHTVSPVKVASTQICLKRADDLFSAPVSEIGRPTAEVLSLHRNPVNNLFGGPTPLATAVTGSALGAGLGYLGGAAAETLFPHALRGKRLRKTLGLAGGVLGAIPGMYLGSLGARADGTGYLEGLTSPGVLSGEPKAASLNDAGGLYLPRVEVDAFNRLVLADPFAPPAVRAGAAALVTAADRSTGGLGLISPADIARIAIGAGAGYVQAYAGAKVLGALAGLSPDAQRAMSQMGTVAGALNAVVPGLFGIR